MIIWVHQSPVLSAPANWCVLVYGCDAGKILPRRKLIGITREEVAELLS